MKKRSYNLSLTLVLVYAGTVCGSLANAQDTLPKSEELATCPCAFSQQQWIAESNKLAKGDKPIDQVCLLIDDKEKGTKTVSMAVANDQNEAYAYAVAWNPSTTTGACVIVINNELSKQEKFTDTDPATPILNACIEKIEALANDQGIKCVVPKEENKAG